MTAEQKEELTKEIIKNTTDTFRKYYEGFGDITTCMEAMADAYLRMEVGIAINANMDKTVAATGIMLHLKTMENELCSYYDINQAETEARLKKMSEDNC